VSRFANPTAVPGHSTIRPARVAARDPPTRSPETNPSRARFLANDGYRAQREWTRYEGTAQRDLFRVLRERFLVRHAGAPKWAIDVGCGPGRFTARLGAPGSTRTVALDIGREMLRELEDHWPSDLRQFPLPDVVQGDALRPPIANRRFELVAALGNLLGFVEEESDQLLETLIELMTPGGTLILEVAPGPGEHSRYLHRLPARSVARLLRSPPRAVASRVVREGFVEEPTRKKVVGSFHRVDPSKLRSRLEARGFRIAEIVAVAPSLGPESARTEAVRGDPKAWEHLLEVEESVGREPERWTAAAAVLIAAAAPA
jgi:SAM-dependent methyltransferase